MEEFKTGDKVYIKSDYEKTVYNSYKIHSLNNTHAIIEIKNQGVLYKKICLSM